MTNANTLADRVEGAEGPSYALDCEIARAINPQATSQTVPPAYSASLDAAMTLVPEGCGVWLHSGSNELGPLLPQSQAPVMARVFFLSKGIDEDAIAATPALALAAAALRARNGSNTDV